MTADSRPGERQAIGSEKGPPESTATVQPRRAFIGKTFAVAGRGVLAVGALLGFLKLREGHRAPAAARSGMGLVRPPGAREEAEFRSRCIRCTRCADSCEARCVRFLGPEAGDLQGTPYILPIERACTLCLKCGEACPSEAILPLESKEEARMGLAVIDERLCVSHNGTGVCGACHTVCPLRNKAITQGLRFAPTIHEDACTGCGLCEMHCIVDERPGLRAVQVKTDRLLPVGMGAKTT